MNRLILFSVLAFGIPYSGYSQNWKPVLTNKTQYFIGPEVNGTDSIIWGFKTNFSHLQGLDSVFTFNRIVRYNEPFQSYWENCNGDSVFITWDSDTELRMNQPNIAGENMAVLNTGGFAFTLKNGDQIWLHPTSPLGVKWLYQSGTTDSAWVVSRGLQNVMGVQDSVAEISISNGHSYLISQSHGLIDWFFHDPIKEESGILAIEQGVLFGIPEMGLGRSVPTFQDLTDLDVGDKFLIHDYEGSGFWSRFRSDFHTVTNLLQTGDTVKYETLLDRIEDSNPLPLMADTLTYIKTPEFLLLPGECKIDSNPTSIAGPFYGTYHAYFKKLAEHNGRIARCHRGIFTIDSCLTTGQGSSFDFEEFSSSTIYLTGLGKIYYQYGFFSMVGIMIQNYEWEMKCYQKVGEPRHGPCDAQFNFIAVDEALSKPIFSLYPNPANQIVTLDFDTDQGTHHTITLSNIQGSMVLQFQSSDPQISIPTQELPGGIYLISVEAENGGRAVKKLAIGH